MREIAVASERAFFDTRTSNHCHYYLEDGRLLDIATEDLAVHGLPEAPTGTHIARIDVIVRLKPVTA
jgi:Fur family iron response transcriptional regulator